MAKQMTSEEKSLERKGFWSAVGIYGGNAAAYGVSKAIEGVQQMGSIFWPVLLLGARVGEKVVPDLGRTGAVRAARIIGTGYFGLKTIGQAMGLGEFAGEMPLEEYSALAAQTLLDGTMALRALADTGRSYRQNSSASFTKDLGHGVKGIGATAKGLFNAVRGTKKGIDSLMESVRDEGDPSDGLSEPERGYE